MAKLKPKTPRQGPGKAPGRDAKTEGDIPAVITSIAEQPEFKESQQARLLREEAERAWREEGQRVFLSEHGVREAEWQAIIDKAVAEGGSDLALQDQIVMREAALAKGPWSKPDTPTRWGKVFGCNAATFVKRCTEGVIRHRELSDRSYQIHVADLPPAATK